MNTAQTFKTALKTAAAVMPTTVNEAGLLQIHAFLSANHRLGGDHFTVEMLQAWATDAEQSLADGNDATIELRAADSIHGRTQTFTVSPDGLD